MQPSEIPPTGHLLNAQAPVVTTPVENNGDSTTGAPRLSSVANSSSSPSVAIPSSSMLNGSSSPTPTVTPGSASSPPNFAGQAPIPFAAEKILWPSTRELAGEHAGADAIHAATSAQGSGQTSGLTGTTASPTTANSTTSTTSAHASNAMSHASSSSTSSTSSHASSQGVPSASSVQSQYAYLRTDPDFNDKRVDWSQKEQLLLEGCNYDGETPLILAAAAGDFDALKVLLKRGANHRHSDQYGHTALVAAARNGALSIVKALTEPELTGGTVHQLQLALAWVAWEGHYDVVEYLMDKVSVDGVITPDGDTPLTLAARAGQKDVVKLLLENGASLHHANASGHGALTLAAAAGHKACVMLLLNTSIDPLFKKFSAEELALALAAAKKYRNVQLAILDFMEKPEYKPSQLQNNQNEQENNLLRAATEGNSQLVAKLIAEGADSNYSDPNGNTALMFAAGGGHALALVNLLITNADIHCTNASHDNALILAAKRGHQKIVDLLLQYGANIEHENKDKRSAEQCARMAGHIQLADQLAQASAVLTAAGVGDEDAVRGLFGHGFCNHVDCYGNTALILAATAGHLKIVRLLVQNFRSDIHHANSCGETALMCATQRNHVDVIKYLMGKADSESLGGDQSDTVLHLAASKGEHALIPSLYIKNFSDINARNSKGYTALCCAAYEGHAQAVSRLAQYVADIFLKNNDGYDALQIAVDHKHVATVEILLALGADPLSVSFPEFRMQAPRHVSSAEISVAPEAYEYAVISDLLRFSESLLGKSPVDIGISVAPIALIDGLMNFEIAGQDNLPASWQKWLQAQGVCRFIIVELEGMTVNVGKVWELFTDPDYTSASTEQKKMCCAGILTGLAEIKLDDEWIKQLLAQGIGKHTLERYRAMLARQQLWLANAGRYIESEMLVRLQGLGAICMSFRSRSNLVEANELYKKLQQMGLVYWLAEIIVNTFTHQVGLYGADLNSRQFTRALLNRMNERDFGKRLDRTAHDTEEAITVFALTVRQIMLLRYACEKLMSES